MGLYCSRPFAGTWRDCRRKPPGHSRRSNSALSDSLGLLAGWLLSEPGSTSQLCASHLASAPVDTAAQPEVPGRCHFGAGATAGMAITDSLVACNATRAAATRTGRAPASGHEDAGDDCRRGREDWRNDALASHRVGRAWLVC